MSDQSSPETPEARLERIAATLRSIDDLDAKVAFFKRQLTITELRRAAYMAAATGEIT